MIHEGHEDHEGHDGRAQRSRLRQALAAQLELVSGGASGAATYRVHGLPEPCFLKVIDAGSAAYVRRRGYREIAFYAELAPRLPIATPRVLASGIEETGSCALLIAAYEPMPPASELRPRDGIEIAAQLARLHATYWGRAEQLRGLSWLARPAPPDIAADVRHARATWRALARLPQFQETLTESTLHAIDVALADITAAPEHAPDAALTLCHGDCHLGNLLRDRDAGLVWTDWQEVGIGHGPSDLSFLLQRAAADGATLAEDDMVAAYCHALESAGVVGVSARAVTSAMHESERRTRLLYWPDYMSQATTEAMTQHLARIFRA